MEYIEFVRKYKNKEILVNININKAGYMYEAPDLMPKKFREKQSLFRLLGFGCFLFTFIL